MSDSLFIHSHAHRECSQVVKHLFPQGTKNIILFVDTNISVTKYLFKFRYTDPEPSEIIVKKTIDYECKADERRYRNSREDLSRHRSSREDLSRNRNSREDLSRHRNSREDLTRYRSSDPRDSDPERKYREDYDGR